MTQRTSVGKRQTTNRRSAKQSLILNVDTTGDETRDTTMTHAATIPHVFPVRVID